MKDKHQTKLLIKQSIILRDELNVVWKCQKSKVFIVALNGHTGRQKIFWTDIRKIFIFHYWWLRKLSQNNFAAFTQAVIAGSHLSFCIKEIKYVRMVALIISCFYTFFTENINVMMHASVFLLFHLIFHLIQVMLLYNPSSPYIHNQFFVLSF